MQRWTKICATIVVRLLHHGAEQFARPLALVDSASAGSEFAKDALRAALEKRAEVMLMAARVSDPHGLRAINGDPPGTRYLPLCLAVVVQSHINNTCMQRHCFAQP
jgi:hypothetical protein